MKWNFFFCKVAKMKTWTNKVLEQITYKKQLKIMYFPDGFSPS